MRLFGAPSLLFIVLNRLREIRQRADFQNAQVRRGDPHWFFGQYPRGTRS
ncbi:MAG TPA: hypothetical protein VFR27_01380 [Mycobacterium sp.]|nr:hypothetical protein [Mycobacterium sp.]